VDSRKPSTPDPSVDSLLVSIREEIGAVTGSSLVGLYLFGSLVAGDFDRSVSDIDLIAVLAYGPSKQQAARLGRMHRDLAEANPGWAGRIEVIYISTHGLANCRTDITTIAVISPGEPFHVVEAGRKWILNWYPAREDGLTLIGPPIDSLIPPIPRSEYIDEVRQHVVAIADQITDDAPPGSQAYAILTMCRGLYTITFGERLSKRQAASWAQQGFPEWADLIRRSLGWRQGQWDPDRQDGTATVSETRTLAAQLADVALK